MQYLFSKFLRSEDGAVTVDWVVLTAAVVGLSATGGTAILTATETLAGNTQSKVATQDVSNGN